MNQDRDLQARLAKGERGIPKIPDSPDTRHAVAAPPAAEGQAPPLCLCGYPEAWHGDPAMRLRAPICGEFEGAAAPVAPPQALVVEKRVVNGNLIEYWKDAETGMWIVRFIEMLNSSHDLEQAIGGLQACVYMQASLFAKGEYPPEAVITPAPRPAEQPAPVLPRSTCNWLEDITYMRKPVPPATKTVMPCRQPALWWNSKTDQALCGSHYDGKVYRKEDVSDFREIAGAEQPSAAAREAEMPHEYFVSRGTGPGRFMAWDIAMEMCKRYGEYREQFAQREGK